MVRLIDFSLLLIVLELFMCNVHVVFRCLYRQEQPKFSSVNPDWQIAKILVSRTYTDSVDSWEEEPYEVFRQSMLSSEQNPFVLIFSSYELPSVELVHHPSVHRRTQNNTKFWLFYDLISSKGEVWLTLSISLFFVKKSWMIISLLLFLSTRLFVTGNVVTELKWIYLWWVEESLLW